jgi:hypothetical protein
MGIRNVFKSFGAALAANGSTPGIDISGASQVTLAAQGAFGGGTITFEISLDNGATWVSSGLTLAAAGSKVLTNPATQVRATLAGATGPNVTCQAGIQHDE